MGSYKEYMNKKTLVGVVVLALLIGGGAFYGGMTYAKTGSPARGGNFTGQFTGGTANRMGGAAARTGGGFTAGQIISKDATSITIKMQDGSTKIVLIGDSTQVMKSANGTIADLSTGITVTVTGSTNSDGSVTAQSVQIRPAGTILPNATPSTTQ